MRVTLRREFIPSRISWGHENPLVSPANPPPVILPILHPCHFGATISMPIPWLPWSPLQHHFMSSRLLTDTRVSQSRARRPTGLVLRRRGGSRAWARWLPFRVRRGVLGRAPLHVRLLLVVLAISPVSLVLSEGKPLLPKLLGLNDGRSRNGACNAVQYTVEGCC